MIPFNWVEAEIRRLAAEDPHKRAEDRYFDFDSQPSCIVGHVFAELGGRSVQTDSEFIVANPAGDLVVAEGDGVREVYWEALGIEAPTGLQIDWIEKVQVEQDMTAPWGVAVQTADAA